MELTASIPIAIEIDGNLETALFPLIGKDMRQGNINWQNYQTLYLSSKLIALRGELMKNTFSLLLLMLLVCALLIISLEGCSNETATATASYSPITAITATQTTTQITTQTTTKASTQTVQAVTLNILAAASLTDAIKAVDNLYIKANPNVTLTPNFAGSGTLQTQIENGAASDIFISAAAAQMDNLQKDNLILIDTRKNLLNNTLVMIVPIDSTLGLTSFNDLATDKVARVAIGDPKSVPCGTYSLRAFDELGITSQVTAKYVIAADVKGVLSDVESGNVDAGLVYSTDALTSQKVKVVANAPSDINAKIVYPVAVIQASQNPDAAKISWLFCLAIKPGPYL